MASAMILSRKVLVGGQIQEIDEVNFKWVERQIMSTGETIEQALERLHAESKQTGDPSKIDYYFYSYPTQ